MGYTLMVLFQHGFEAFSKQLSVAAAGHDRARRLPGKIGELSDGARIPQGFAIERTRTARITSVVQTRFCLSRGKVWPGARHLGDRLAERIANGSVFVQSRSPSRKAKPTGSCPQAPSRPGRSLIASKLDLHPRRRGGRLQADDGPAGQRSAAGKREEKHRRADEPKPLPPSIAPRVLRSADDGGQVLARCPGLCEQRQAEQRREQKPAAYGR